MKYLGLFILSTAFLFLACKKDEYEYENPAGYTQGCPRFVAFEGTVVDSLTGNPISGVQIWDDFPCYTDDVSDSNGHYLVKEHYYLCAKVGQTICYSEKSPFQTVSVSQNAEVYGHVHVNTKDAPHNFTFHRDIVTVPYSHLNVHVTGTAPAGEEFRLVWRRKAWATDFVQLGNTVDSIVDLKVYSSRTTSIDLYVNNSLYSSTEYLAGYGNTGNLEIHYP